jgi:phosphoenolpyruvate carboxylase
MAGKRELFWSAPDQHQRLDELISDSAATKEAPLRRDVRSLGTILGDTLAEQVSPAFLDQVERIRTFMVARRERATPESDAELVRDAQQLVREMSLPDAYRTAKAFGSHHLNPYCVSSQIVGRGVVDKVTHSVATSCRSFHRP